MEIIVHPRAFSVGPTHIPGGEGQPIEAMAIQYVDPTGTVIRIVFGLPDFMEFQRAVGDPVAFAASMEARAKILKPGSTAPSVKKIH